MASAFTYLEKLAQESKKPEAEVMTQAFEIGIRQMQREEALGRYLRGQTTRDEAIETTGIDWVEMAERQHKAMLEDLAWALRE